MWNWSLKAWLCSLPSLGAVSVFNVLYGFYFNAFLWSTLKASFSHPRKRLLLSQSKQPWGQIQSMSTWSNFWEEKKTKKGEKAPSAESWCWLNFTVSCACLCGHSLFIEFLQWKCSGARFPAVLPALLSTQGANWAAPGLWEHLQPPLANLTLHCELSCLVCFPCSSFYREWFAGNGPDFFSFSLSEMQLAWIKGRIILGEIRIFLLPVLLALSLLLPVMETASFFQ